MTKLYLIQSSCHRKTENPNLCDDEYKNSSQQKVQAAENASKVCGNLREASLRERGAERWNLWRYFRESWAQVVGWKKVSRSKKERKSGLFKKLHRRKRFLYFLAELETETDARKESAGAGTSLNCSSLELLWAFDVKLGLSSSFRIISFWAWFFKACDNKICLFANLVH